MKSVHKERIKDNGICILQLARLGDLLQVAKSCENFTKNFPSTPLYLIARKQYAQPLMFILKNIFDEIFLFDSSLIINHKDQSTTTNSRKYLQDFIENLRPYNFKVLANFTLTKSSQYLSSAIHTKYRLGPYRDISDNLIIPDKWSSYLYSFVLESKISFLNLVDIYKRVLGTYKKNKTTKKSAISNKSGYLVFAPITSHERKMWPLHFWVIMLSELAKDFQGMKIVFIGTGAKNREALDIALNSAQKVLLNTIKIYNAIDRTDIREVFYLVKNCSALIGHDSFPSHVSSFYQKRTVVISLGTVKRSETTPYLDDVLTISPNLDCSPCFLESPCSEFICHSQTLNNDTIISISKYLKNSFCLESSKSNYIDTFISKTIGNDLLHVPLIPHNYRLRDYFKIYYLGIWKFMYDEEELNFEIPKIENKAILERMKSYFKIIEVLYELNSIMDRYTDYFIIELEDEQKRETTIKNYLEKIQDSDIQQRKLLRSFTLYAPLLNFHNINRMSYQHNNYEELAVKAKKSYTECNMALSILYEYIETTLKHNDTKFRDSRDNRPPSN